MRMNQALKGRHRFLADYAKACVALSGLKLNSILKPRVPEPAVRAPPPWALLHRAFSALGIRLSLTRMPFRALFSYAPDPGLTPGAILFRPFGARAFDCVHILGGTQ